MMMAFNALKAEKVKGWIEKLAYASLILDMLIAVASLVSINLYSGASSLLLDLDYALSAEVVITIVLFAAFVVLERYERAIEISLVSKSKNKKWLNEYRKYIQDRK